MKLKKVLGYGLLGLVALVVIGAGIFWFFVVPHAPPVMDVKVESTPEKVARGKYLAESVMYCANCHSEHDYTKYAAPVVPGTEYTGWCIADWYRIPGRICGGNLTSDKEYGLGSWTDGEIIRAVREGWNREGRPLFGMHTAVNYWFMSDDDAKALVAFLRSIPPNSRHVDKTKMEFFDQLGAHFDAPPKHDGPIATPDPKDSVAYGKYLVTLARCRICHTGFIDGHEGPEFAGGENYGEPGGGKESPANLTPDPKTGIGMLTKEQFVGRFKAFLDLPTVEVKKGQNNKLIMPWRFLATMSEDDLGHIYDFLKTVKPYYRPAGEELKPGGNGP